MGQQLVADAKHRHRRLGLALLVLGLALLSGWAAWSWRGRTGAAPATTISTSPTSPASASAPALELRPRAPSSATREASSQTEAIVDNPRLQPQPASAIASTSRFGALGGRVFNWSTRQGVAGAELDFMHDGVSHTVVSQADGSYHFDAPTAGVWSLATLTADGYLPYAPELGGTQVVFVARPGRDVQHVDLQLFPAIDYLGTVVDDGGQPVAGAEVELFEAETGNRAMVGIRSRFRSDAHGRFEFNAPDDAVLEARHPDHARGRARVDGAVQLSHELTITLGSAPAASTEAIHGALVDAHGEGLAGVEIEAKPVNDFDSLARSAFSISEADGSFVLAPLDQRSYVVRARLRGRPWPHSDPVEPGARVELTASAGLTLAGRVVDEAGQPIPVASVVLLAVDGPLARPLVASLSLIDAEGAFEFTELEPGAYELLAAAHARPRSQPVAASVPSSGVVTIVLERGAGVYGTVVEADSNKPLELALVTVQGLDGDAPLPGSSSTVTDDAGSFELVGVTPGRVSISAAAFAHDGRVVSGIELESGHSHGPLTIELPAVAAGERPKTEITGIGVAIGPQDDALVVAEVIAGGGAEAAGIVAGEQILSVDGVTVVELGFERAIQNIRGPIGTTVALELARLDGSRAILVVQRRLVRG